MPRILPVLKPPVANNNSNPVSQLTNYCTSAAKSALNECGKVAALAVPLIAVNAYSQNDPSLGNLTYNAVTTAALVTSGIDVLPYAAKFGAKAAWWSAGQIWDITSESAKWSAGQIWGITPGPVKTAVKVSLGVIGSSLVYQGFKAAKSAALSTESGPLNQVLELGAPVANALMTHLIGPIGDYAAPLLELAAPENIKEFIKGAVEDTAKDTVNGLVPFAAKGTVSLGKGIIVEGTKFLIFDALPGTWRVVTGLEPATYGYLLGGLAAGWYAKYRAMPGIRKFCTGVPLPSWIWSSDARRVTPLSRGVQMLKNRIWKDKEVEPILNEDIRKRVEAIITANHNILNNGGIFTNILLLGDPGIGKTMLAEKIARDSGFNFIKVTGADFAWRLAYHSGSGNGAVKALNEIIAFSRNSYYPTVLVIDEIEAICPNPKRLKNPNPSREEKEFRSALLSAIGRSNKLLIVGTTNHEDHIDPGLRSRFANKIIMTLPDRDSRVKILTQYIDKHLGDIPERATCLSQKNIEKLAERTEGMSGRTLFDFVYSLVMQRPASFDQRLTEESIEEVLINYLADIERDREAEKTEEQKRVDAHIAAERKIAEERRRVEDTADPVKVAETPKVEETPAITAEPPKVEETPKPAETPTAKQPSIFERFFSSIMKMIESFLSWFRAKKLA